jgi:hypothetical protein
VLATSSSVVSASLGSSALASSMVACQVSSMIQRSARVSVGLESQPQQRGRSDQVYGDGQRAEAQEFAQLTKIKKPGSAARTNATGVAVLRASTGRVIVAAPATANHTGAILTTELSPNPASVHASTPTANRGN